MPKQTLPSVPLITSDPYFSVWSPANALTEADAESWMGAKKPLTGVLTVDGKAYRFMGVGEFPAAEQTGLTITATSSVYTFAAGGVTLTARFTSPLLLSDLELVSRPCAYLDFTVESADGASHEAEIKIAFDEAHCYDGEEQKAMLGGLHRLPGFTVAWMGREKNEPLSHSGDGITIDWGYLYLALPGGQDGEARYNYDVGDRCDVSASLRFQSVTAPQNAYLVAAYDDVLSIMYFGEARRAWWARNGKTILEAIDEAVREHSMLVTRCDVFDRSLEKRASDLAGEDYARVCAAAYRQTIAAHKLVSDLDGNPLFFSKECHSNGCLGTADVSYPSTPLFLLMQPDLVRGMLRPVFRFARMPVWEYDYAPHDVGRFPYANGQVYGVRGYTSGDRNAHMQNGGVHPPYYIYPAGSGIYEHHMQMPVEECGNMIIMTAAACVADDDFTIAEENMDLLRKWVCYLIEYGSDPGNQLCTDDFAGHLAHNVNLSAKAVMGIACYAMILEKLGDDEQAKEYNQAARTMAESLLERANRGDHTALTYDGDGWSLKYNLAWDLLFERKLFPESFYEKEIRWYVKHANRFGTPLDSRREYTKSDWILWASVFGGKEEMRQMIAPVAAFLRESPDRVPFSDWYETVTGEHHSFQNRTVQGGLFMPLLFSAWKDGGD